MATAPDVPGPDSRLRLPRLATLAYLAMSVLTSMFMPGIGVFGESDSRWFVLGAVGVLLFGAAHGAALYTVVTPWLTEPARRRLLAGFGIASVGSVPLVGPAGSDDWSTWAWLGASIVGAVPLLLRRWAAGAAMLAATVVSAAVAWCTRGSVAHYVAVTAGIGLGVAAVNWLQVWFWDLLVQAQQGRAAQARLSVTEERLRFAQDVHDLLGHSLSVIALKTELAARLAPVDAERAGREAGEVQRLAASALTEVREAVHGYRTIDLHEQLAATVQVLRSCGVRCTVTQPPGELAPDVAFQLVPVLREASTNVLRHSRATWCTIDITEEGDEVRMTVTNDAAAGARPDRHSFGLRGMADRLAAAHGRLRTATTDGVFTLEATVRATR
ncbi:histidine kinase [Micromonospora sp. B11E3]|uniref:sensor histidine kinase n=1 Tax=Micromonospora sp. B11E3 TaxID=3153562 RepID=UPI00325E974A